MIANFPKYDIVYDHLCSCGANVRIKETDILGAFVKFTDVEASLNSLQQLKAEIAALVQKYESETNDMRMPDVDYLIKRMRQLSAV